MNNETKIAKYIHKVQYYETDQMQIVHHSNYFRFYEEARTAFMESVGLNYDVLEKHGIIIPVTSVSSDYIGVGLYPHELEIQSTIVKYTGVRMTVRYKVYDLMTGELINKGESNHAFVNKEFKPFAMQKEFPEYHQRFLDYTVTPDE
ncbi:MAG: acyl-CoA thioesterase [Clostridiaceae bacterium]|nr:acyl-CoA thioesterase [Clostridiaceae bacterium]